eukprot:c15893_g1_i1.p1 GENE.c15893_g1_i1~~c15893_g1_i1.p1  ORF type:complete len:402 (+),score=90.01 c15893_g1_i1:1-1206(+)
MGGTFYIAVMPPKKEVVEKKPLLGRPGNNVKAGIVGLPNVGKSSLFNILCDMQVRAENFPFCTIDPNVSRVALPDERFDWLVGAFQPEKVIPAYLNVTDIAGLIKGAHEGEGLGNAFLSHIQATDAIYQVVRIFEDSEILHVDESIDPLRDMVVISDELRLKDIETLEREVAKMDNLVSRGIDKSRAPELEFAKGLLESLKAGNEARFGDYSARDIEFLNNYLLLTAKPVIYLLNLCEEDYIRKKNKWLAKVAAWLKTNRPGDSVIPFSVKFEEKLRAMSKEDAAAYCAQNDVKSALPKIITIGYEKLGLINFFTCGPIEVRSWTIRRETKVPQAAAVIHTDFEKHFIMAEVMAYADFREHGSEAKVVAAGKLQMRGKEYVVQDGDILHIKHNAGGAGRKK